MQSSRGDAGISTSSRRTHPHQYAAPPSTSRSSRILDTAPSSMLPPDSSSSTANGPLTRERMQMEQIRAKLERAQQRLAKRNAEQNATPGSSRYYPPNYTSTHARTPAPPVQSVRFEDFSQLQHAYTPAPNSTASGYLGAYPPSQRHDRHAPSTRSRHPERSHAPPATATGTVSTRPTRQSVPAPAASARPAQSSRAHRQQYPPELQYRSTSRNLSSDAHDSQQGTLLSTSAPFLVYSTSSKVPPVSAMRNGGGHDRTREPSASAMRSALQPPPSSRVRFEGDVNVDATARGHQQTQQQRERERDAARAAAVDKARERQREKELALRDMVRADRERRAREHDEETKTQDQNQKQQPTGDRTERSRRGSLPTPPKSEIDVSAFELVTLGLPASPSAAATATTATTATRPHRSSTTALAAPPKSAIQASAFAGAPGRHRSAATNDVPAALVYEDNDDLVTAAASPTKAATPTKVDRLSATKRDASSDDDEFATPPTSPSSGGSSSSSDAANPSATAAAVAAMKTPPRPAATKTVVTVAPTPAPTPVIDAVPLPSPVADAPLAVHVRPVATDYDDSLFANATAASPSKKKHLSIWQDDDEDAIIAATRTAKPAPRHEQTQPLQSPSMRSPRRRHEGSPPSAAVIWNNDNDVDGASTDDDNDNNDSTASSTPAVRADIAPASPVAAAATHRSNQSQSPSKHDETVLFKSVASDAKATAAAERASNNQDVDASVANTRTKREPAPEASPNQELSPTKASAPSPSPPQQQPRSSMPSSSSRTTSTRPDLRSRISAALQAFNESAAASGGAPQPPVSPVANPRAAVPPPSSVAASSHASSAVPERRAAPPMMLPPRSAITVPRAPSTALGRPSVTRPRVPPSPPHPQSARPQFPAPPSMHLSAVASGRTASADNQSQSQRRSVRHREPLELKRQLPPSIGVLAGLSSGPITFPLNAHAFYDIEWRTGEFGFSFQVVYAEAYGSDDDSVDSHKQRQLFLRMLLDTDRSTCRSFHAVRVGDILIQIGDTRVCDLGFDAARDVGAALTKYFTELRDQTPLRLVFQRMEVLDWEGGVEL